MLFTLIVRQTALILALLFSAANGEIASDKTAAPSRG